MRTRLSGTAALVIALIAITSGIAAGTTTTSPPRYCGVAKYSDQGNPGKTYRLNVYVIAGRISCSAARAAFFIAHGQTCRYQNQGLWWVCHRSRSTIRYIPWAGG